MINNVFDMGYDLIYVIRGNNFWISKMYRWKKINCMVVIMQDKFWWIVNSPQLQTNILELDLTLILRSIYKF